MQHGISKQQYRGFRALNVLLFVVTSFALIGAYWPPQPTVQLATFAPLTQSYEPAQPIPLNLAQPVDLLRVKGLGPKTVEHIDYCRKCLGGFTDKRQLLRIPGIGKRTFARLDTQLVLTDWGRHLWATHPALRPWAPDSTANLNNLTSKALYRVCVLEKAAARRVLSKRKSLGGFRNWSEIAALDGIGWQSVVKLKRHFHIAPPAFISLNHSTIADWQNLPRVGEKTAQRIVQYREQLGGFHLLEQLDDVRGIGPKTMAGFRGRLQAAAPEAELHKIDLSQSTETTLAKHPYITANQANQTVNARAKVRLTSSFLIEQQIFTRAEIERLRPYLSNFR